MQRYKSILPPADTTVTAKKGQGIVLFNYKPAPDLVDPYVGTTIASQTGTYSIRRLLNSGGMGSVYLAEAQDRKRESVAVKFLHRKLLTGDANTYIRRFMREAEALSLIDHPNVVKVLGYGNNRRDIYLVTEYLAGKSLDSILAEYVSKHKPMPWGRISNLLGQVCDGVQAAHDKKIWHRDIKPSNVIVMKNDRVKLIDFGTAKLDQPDVSSLTSTGIAIGTFAYMAPEMLSPPTPYDHRGDVYGIGSMMYELLCGSKLFEANDLRTFSMKILYDQPQSFTERVPGYGIPSEVEAIVMRALAKSPGERFQSVMEFGEAIAGCEWDGRPVLDPALFPRRTHAGAIVAAAAALALSCALATGWHFRGPLTDFYNGQAVPALRARGLPMPPIPVPARTYEACVYSSPQGAQVYEVLAGGSEKYLGTTPLTASFSGAHTLVVKSGKQSICITLSEKSPTAILQFHSRHRAAAATEAAGDAAGSFEADSGGAEAEAPATTDSAEADLPVPEQ